MKNLMRSMLFALLTLPCLFSPVSAADAPKPVAKVGNTVLNEDDMRKDMGMQLYQAENNLYMTQKSWIDQKAQEIMFDQAAKEAGLSRKAWEAREIDAKAAPVDQTQVVEAAGRFARPGVSSTDTLKMAADYLATQNKLQRRAQLAQELSTKIPVTVMVYKPEAPHFNVSYSADDPVKGNAKAPVTIVEFTDFQCPYCKRSQDTLRQVEQAYPTQVKLVARQYPLPFHDRAKPAAEAALCAKEQGKFWEYRDKLFDKQQLSDADLQRYADEIGLKKAKFTQCLSSHKYAERIQKDITEGQKYGVTGTPAFFVNGEMIVGAQPIQSFVQAIDTALAKKK